MAEYIDRQALIDLFQRVSYDDWNQGGGTTWANAYKEAAALVEAIPSADVEPVRHGRWINGGYACGETEWICSKCGFTEWRTSNSRMIYCMHCGARMEGEEDDSKGND